MTDVLSPAQLVSEIRKILHRWCGDIGDGGPASCSCEGCQNICRFADEVGEQVDQLEASLRAQRNVILDLREALKWLLNEVESERDYEHWQGVIDPARAAIAKADSFTDVEAWVNGRERSE